jgi:hypothetical protein
MEADKEKLESIIDVIQLKSSLEDEKWIEEDHLNQAVGEEISTEIYYLRESGVIELTERADQNYIGFTEDASNELRDIKPFNIDLNLEELENLAENTEEPVIEYDDLLDKGMEIEYPEKYVAVLKRFGDVIDHNPEMALREEELMRYVGEDLEFQLRTLTEWGYLTELAPEEIDMSGTESSFYRLNIDDDEVQADAAFASIHIDKYYDGCIEQFLREHSDEDRKALRKNGVKFYQAVG